MKIAAGIALASGLLASAFNLDAVTGLWMIIPVVIVYLILRILAASRYRS